MKKVVVLSLLLMLFSCQNKEVLLPKENETVLMNVKNYSTVYFFFKTEEKDTLVEVERNDLINSNNWLFNIDKRLPLRKVILEIKKLQAKKAASTHKNEISGDYFTYISVVKNTKAFLPFTKIKYMLEKPDFDIPYFYLDRNDLVHFKDEVFSKNELQAYIDKQISPIFFAYDKGMSFDKYIKWKFFVMHLVAHNEIIINQNKEYIY